jgi:hypothetical protein
MNNIIQKAYFFFQRCNIFTKIWANKKSGLFGWVSVKTNNVHNKKQQSAKHSETSNGSFSSSNFAQLSADNPENLHTGENTINI